MNGEMHKFYGKYRGTVVNIDDPMQLGRIQAQVPDVLGLELSTWAMPCFPSTGKQSGIWSLPQVGSGVWIEFEQGDPDYPVWSGCWYGSAAEVPAQALTALPGSSNILLQTSGQTVVLMSDAPGPQGGILLKTASGAMIAINDSGITITNGQGATISLSGPTVSINDGALQVV
jgi:uncharacterized protein involved in type VI secretion and phage assembly